MMIIRNKLIFCSLLIVLATLISCDVNPEDSIDVEITPEKKYFGVVFFGESVVEDFVITNNNAEEITIFHVSISGRNADQFLIIAGDDTPVLINADGGFHQLSVRYTPTCLSASAILNILISDIFGRSHYYSVKLEGYMKTTGILTTNATGTPPTLDFGQVLINTAPKKILTIENTGNANFEIFDIQVSIEGFSIHNGWSGNQMTVESNGESLEITFCFSPTELESYYATLSIIHNIENISSPYEIELTGKGAGYSYTVTAKPISQKPRVSGSQQIIWEARRNRKYENDTQLIPIGFAFNFFGINYTEVYVSVNGFVSFSDPGNPNTDENTAIPDPAGQNNIIAPMWDKEWKLKEYGYVYYEVIGSAPNRQFVVEWYCIRNEAGINYAYFGCALHESTMIIETYYYFTDNAIINTGASIGIENIDGLVGYEGKPGSPQITNWPENDYVYTPNWLPQLNGNADTYPADKNVNDALICSGGAAPYRYSFNNWSPEEPVGLFFNADGSINGTPVDLGYFTVEVEVEDSVQFSTTMFLTVHISSYEVTSFQLGMTPFFNGTPVDLGDDDFSQVPIGFTFEFFGKEFSEIFISSNGTINFGAGDCSFDIDPFPNQEMPNNVIALFCTDLFPYMNSLSYKLKGDAQNRVLTVQFNCIPGFCNGVWTGQIKLYESSNIIELCYSSTSLFWLQDAIVGIENEDGSEGISYDGSYIGDISYAPTANIRYTPNQ